MKNEPKPGQGKAVSISGLRGAMPTEKISLRPDLNILFSGPTFEETWKSFRQNKEKNGRKPPAYVEQVYVTWFFHLPCLSNNTTAFISLVVEDSFICLFSRYYSFIFLHWDLSIRFVHYLCANDSQCWIWTMKRIDCWYNTSHMII